MRYGTDAEEESAKEHLMFRVAPLAIRWVNCVIGHEDSGPVATLLVQRAARELHGHTVWTTLYGANRAPCTHSIIFERWNVKLEVRIDNDPEGEITVIGEERGSDGFADAERWFSAALAELDVAA